MLSMYPACFYKEKDGRYTVIFPDLNHLATCGTDLQDAMKMATDCLAGFLYEAKLSNEAVPEPSELNTIDVNEEYNDYAEAFVNIVAMTLITILNICGKAYVCDGFLSKICQKYAIVEFN